MNTNIKSYGRQFIDAQDIDAVVAVLKSDYLTDGPAVDKLESALSKRWNDNHVAACANGTAALHLACMGYDIGNGGNDVVIVPAITFVATANAPAMSGAKVIFADVDPETGLMGPEHLEDALVRAERLGHPRAIFPVHLNGQVAPLDALSGIARRKGMLVIEDACHALGGQYRRDGSSGPVGDTVLSNAACFSFHPVKTVAMGEGGAISSRDAAFIERVRQLRAHGIVRKAEDMQQPELATAPSGERNPWYHEMQRLGYNYRLSDIHSALGASQLVKLDRFVEKRRRLVARYRSQLADLGPHISCVREMQDQSPGWHLMVVLINFAAFDTNRASVMGRLKAEGIATQVHYLPVPWQPYWREHSNTPDLPGAVQYYERALSLPLFHALEEEDVDHVVATLARCIGL